MAKLSEIFDLQMGKTPARSKSEYWNNGDNAWVSISDLSAYCKYVGETKETISNLAVADSGIKPVPADTVIMSFKLSIGKTAITVDQIYTNEAIMAFVPNGKYSIYPSYFYHFFGGRDWSVGTNRAVMGSTLNKATLGNIDIVVPSLDEQKRISEHLDRVDNLIFLRKLQLSKLDELVKSRFVELFGSIKNNHQRYPVVKIGSCAKLQGGFAFKSSDYLNDGIRLVQISNVNKDTLDWDSINCVPQAFLQKYKDFELHVGDLVLAMTRPVIKSLDAVKIATVSENDVPSLLNQRVGRFVVDRKKLHSVYLMVLCQMPEFREYVEAMSGNSLQPNISSKQVEDYSIVLPPLALQEQFATFVEQTDKSKFEIQKSLEKLETLKKALMQKYFG